ESNSSAQMGSDDIDDYQIPVTDASKISSVRAALIA
ncbi:copper homeostasis protein CutC, partial [Vibrio splendidus]